MVYAGWRSGSRGVIEQVLEQRRRVLPAPAGQGAKVGVGGFGPHEYHVIDDALRRLAPRRYAHRDAPEVLLSFAEAQRHVQLPVRGRPADQFRAILNVEQALDLLGQVDRDRVDDVAEPVPHGVREVAARDWSAGGEQVLPSGVRRALDSRDALGDEQSSRRYSREPVTGPMQRRDQRRQVGLSRVARSDEDGERSQIDGRAGERSEVSNLDRGIRMRHFVGSSSTPPAAAPRWRRGDPERQFTCSFQRSTSSVFGVFGAGVCGRVRAGVLLFNRCGPRGARSDERARSRPENGT